MGRAEPENVACSPYPSIMVVEKRGTYPDVSLQKVELPEARRRHQEARELLAKGVDPSAAKKAQKAAGAGRATNTFDVVAREWFDGSAGSDIVVS
jgi:hypothetical protein